MCEDGRPEQDGGRPRPSAIFIRLGDWARGVSRIHRLYGALAIYAILLLIYIFGTDSELLKNIVTLAGVIFAAAIPELVDKKQLLRRVLLICVPIAGIAMVQLANDHANDAKFAGVSRQLHDQTAQLQIQSSQLREQNYRRFMDQARATEAARREEIAKVPLDVVLAVKNADEGFLNKAEIIGLSVAADEAGLISRAPSIAKTILGFPEDVEDRLAAYNRLVAGPASIDGWSSNAALRAIADKLAQQAAYIEVAEFVRAKVKPVYSDMLAANPKPSDADLRAELAKIIEMLRPLAERYKIAGLYNHVGVLSMALERRESALSFFYLGYLSDEDHLPIYDSLAYALWSINGNSAAALDYASRGLKRAAQLGASLPRAVSEALQLYRAALQSNSDAAREIQKRVDDLMARSTALDANWPGYIVRITNRLNLQFAYYSALELSPADRIRALAVMRELYNSDPDDAEYQDALGFVLMRYQPTGDALEQAKVLFDKAIKNTHGEDVTHRLAERHQTELKDLVEQLEKGLIAATSPAAQ